MEGCHGQPADRYHAQSLEHGHDAWRLFRVVASAACAARMEPAAYRIRWWWIDPYTGRLCRYFRAQAAFWPGAVLSAKSDGYAVHAGPMTRTVSDALLMLNVLIGEETRDWTTVPSSQIHARAISGGSRICGWPSVRASDMPMSIRKSPPRSRLRLRPFPSWVLKSSRSIPGFLILRTCSTRTGNPAPTAPSAI